MATAPREHRGSGVPVVAAILIVIGICALAGNLAGARIGGDSFVLAVGLAFLTAYAATRKYGFLVPGGIVSGVGAGIVITDLLGTTDNGGIVVIAGGVGFLAIYIIDLLVTRTSDRWWPAIPGGLMMIAGAATATNVDWVSQQARIWVPVLLIGLGVLLLLTRTHRGDRGR